MHVIAIFLSVFWAIFIFIYYRKSDRYQFSHYKWLFQGPAKTACDLIKLEELIQFSIHHLHGQYMILHRFKWNMKDTTSIIYDHIGRGFLIIIGASWLATISGEWLVLIVGIAIAIVFVLRIFQEGNKKVNLRKQQILLELSPMLLRLILLIGAGDTLTQAFIRCVENKQHSDHPLHQEWTAAANLLKNGQSFQVVMEYFNRHCSVQQIAMLTTLMLLNYRRGGEHFVLAVQDLSHSLWENRKMLARTKGEEASSKLIFPLVGVLLIVMVLIITPAVMLMNF